MAVIYAEISEIKGDRMMRKEADAEFTIWRQEL